MSEIFCVKLPRGEMWTPTFVSALDDEKCIGCGRCFRVCSRGVLQLVGVDEEGDLTPVVEDDDDEYEKKVMTIARRELCIGCTACARICPKKCYTHAVAMD
ncbi:ferredoxin III, nif-specific [Paraburkholderia sp. UYCP14C]|uniref:ferredoxin III, nif-specific n=1 Tax=Paraburkholderia sp. UYCP14C TaxID=2511130 RepID=UPI00102275C0|nr:ferredoxin III, nif-specific [Paraburkholderia sp. UYCP14C]RZF23633.1 ferredoxin III, nif-specific [Paraburkholderia sp. UYCP14C]